MPYREFGDDDRFPPDIELPLHLEHKPVYAMPYQRFDGIYREDTDARYLSIGLAQWGNNDLSLKVMRHTGAQWTRQAEELPLHRVFDAAIFLAKVLLDNEDNKVEIEKQSFEGQDSAIQVLRESLCDEDEEVFNNYISQHGELLRRRINALYQTLASLKAKGKL
jgi:hypothetical protein